MPSPVLLLARQQLGGKRLGQCLRSQGKQRRLSNTPIESEHDRPSPGLRPQSRPSFAGFGSKPRGPRTWLHGWVMGSSRWLNSLVTTAIDTYLPAAAKKLESLRLSRTAAPRTARAAGEIHQDDSRERRTRARVRRGMRQVPLGIDGLLFLLRPAGHPASAAISVFVGQRAAMGKSGHGRRSVFASIAFPRRCSVR